LFIRLYLDENVFPDLAAAVRQRGFDATSAFDAGMLGKPDEEQLLHAASEGRCLMTFDAKDLVPLGVSWSIAGREHAGILVTEPVSRRGFGTILRRTLVLLNTTTAAEMRNIIRHL
jgi:predicted nuclease of predicted toxin-antitoxin system